jgi:hypothetical protein
VNNSHSFRTLIGHPLEYAVIADSVRVPVLESSEFCHFADSLAIGYLTSKDTLLIVDETFNKDCMMLRVVLPDHPNGWIVNDPNIEIVELRKQ